MVPQLKKRDMKKESVVAVAMIGTMFLGLTLVAFGNPLGAFLVAGVVMLAGGL